MSAPGAHSSKYGIARCFFESQFTKVQHQEKSSFVENQLVYSQTKFLSRGATFWNKVLDQQQNSLGRETCFKKSIKLSLLSLENEIRLF